MPLTRGELPSPSDMGVRRSPITQTTVDNIPVARLVLASNLSVAYGPVISILPDANDQLSQLMPFGVQEETHQEIPWRNEEKRLTIQGEFRIR